MPGCLVEALRPTVVSTVDLTALVLGRFPMDSAFSYEIAGRWVRMGGADPRRSAQAAAAKGGAESDGGRAREAEEKAPNEATTKVKSGPPLSSNGATLRTRH